MLIKECFLIIFQNLFSLSFSLQMFLLLFNENTECKECLYSLKILVNHKYDKYRFNRMTLDMGFLLLL